jgi:4-hydroxy-2-oxovalerate aldolase
MLRLLDTTLRDGSYIVDFQFTVADTAVIAGALDAHHVPFIEVGHGMGLGAYRDPRYAAAATDLGYAEAAAGAVQHNRWGVFCIPGVATLDDLDRAADTGMSFVRVGTNVTETEAAVPFLERARARGLFVFANFMKTYALGADEVAQRARRLQDAGAQVACVVDSAGGMLPEDVAQYVEALRAALSIEIGFHGHDNLGMAVANTLTAVAHGATIIDTSLRGMGRSAGNASTERTLFALLRRGHDLGIDPVALLTLAEQRIDPLLQRANRDTSIGIASGYAQFHSTFQPIVDEVADARGIDRCDLLIAVTAADKVNAPRHVVERAADALQAAPSRRARITVARPEARALEHEASLERDVARLASDLHSAARRLGRRSVLNLVQQLRPATPTTMPSTWHEGLVAVVATVALHSAEQAARVVAATDGLVDELLVDADAHPMHGGWLHGAVHPTTSGVLPYSDVSAWASAVLDAALSCCDGEHAPSGIALLGARGAPLTDAITSLTDARGMHLRPALHAHGARVVVLSSPQHQDARHLFDLAAPPSVLIDAWVGALPSDVVSALRAAGTVVMRPDMRATLQAEIIRAIDARARAPRSAGCIVRDGIPMVAGGVLAPRGTIVVDSLTAPRIVHGVADGHGLLLDRRTLDRETAVLLRRAEDLLLYSVG